MPGQLLGWYVAMELFALAGWPWAFLWLRRLPSRGYALARPLGLLLTGFLLWWGGIFHLWGTSLAAVLTALLLVFGGGLRLAWRERGAWMAWWRSQRRLVIATEVLFAAAFLGWAMVRAAQPQIETAGGEKWMEIAFLNAHLRSPSMPPHDPWLAGYAISYYYFGYLLMAMLTRLSGLPATVAFNLANAGWFAMAAAGAFGLLYDLLEGEKLLAALWSPFLLLLTGNGEGWLEVLHARGLLPPRFWVWLDIRSLNVPPTPPFSWIPQRYFWWWQASRVIHDYDPWGRTQEVIDEFPAFSFILGDMHPHLLALPFVVLVVGVALDLWRRPAFTFPSLRRLALDFMLMAAVVGALGFLNTWDFPIYWGLLALLFYLRAHGPWSLRLVKSAAFASSVGVASVVLYLPFWVGLRSQAGGLLPNLFNATRPVQLAVVFWPFLVPMAALVVEAARRARIGWRQFLSDLVPLLAVAVVMALLLGLTGGGPFLRAFLRGEGVAAGLDGETVRTLLLARLRQSGGLVLLAAVVLIVGRALFVVGHRRERLTFVWVLTLLGAGLVLTPELLYLRDLFGTRMNTVFKFYFEAWLLWSIAAAWWLAEGGRRGVYAVALFFIATVFLYTPLAARARALEHGTPWSLDGALWIARQHPTDWTLIERLQAQVEGRPVIVEAPFGDGGSYTYGGRMAAFTGLPDVVGWVGHEQQWRGTADEAVRRVADVDRLYTTDDAVERERLLRRYHVRYVIVGEVELQRYGPGLAERWAAYPLLFREGAAAIYAVGAP